MKTKMKKNLIKAMVVTTLCSLGVAVALSPANVNASAASLDEGKFEMIGGASIRIGSELTGAQTDNSNGIRFSAEIDVDTYDTLKANNDSVAVGTFIMPYDYISWFGELNEETCFGANAKYYWQTAGFGENETPAYNTDNTTGLTQIRHVAGNVYKTNSEIQTGTVEVYRVNGSLVNILDPNLGRSMIGVSYLAVTNDSSTTYYFAETDAEANQRSIAHVSQNILLKDGAEGTYSGYATDYLEDYIEANATNGLTVEVKADCYEINENGFTKKSTIVDETVTIDSVDDFTAIYGGERGTDWAPTLAGYKYASGHQLNKETGALKLDGSASYEYYFYAENTHVLFDGSYAATTTEVLTHFAGSVNVNTIYDGWNVSDTTSEYAQWCDGYKITTWQNTGYSLVSGKTTGSIFASTNTNCFGTGEGIRWVDWGNGFDAQKNQNKWSKINYSYTRGTSAATTTGVVMLNSVKSFTITMKIKNISIDASRITDTENYELAVGLTVLNTANNWIQATADIQDKIQPDNTGWYEISVPITFAQGAVCLTDIDFTTSHITGTNSHFDIGYISLTPIA